MHSDNLYKMFRIQKEFQEQLGAKYDIQYQKDMILAAHAELDECLQCIPWKPWKKNQKYDLESLQIEIVDVMHFLINLSISCDMTATKFYTLYMKKHLRNRVRQKEGY